MDLMRQEEFEDNNVIWADLAAALAARKILILIVLLATILSTYGVLQFYLTENYETTARLLVELGRENTEVPPTVQKGVVTSFGVRKEELTSETLILSSRNIIEDVVDKIGIEAFTAEPPLPETLLQAVKYYIKKGARWAKEQFHSFLIMIDVEKQLTAREKVILGIETALRVEVDKESDVLSVNLRLPDPELAVHVLNVLLQLYLDHHIQVRGNSSFKKFFDDQAENHRKQLEKIEMAKEEIKTTWNLISVPEQRTLLLKQLQRFKSQMSNNETERATLQARKAWMRTRLNSLPDEIRQSQVVNPNPLLQSIKERLTSVQQERAKLVTAYNPESLKIKNMDQEISALQEMLAEKAQTVIGAVTSQVNPLKQDFKQNIEEIEVQISGLEANSQHLRFQAIAVESQLERLNIGETKLTVVERERQVAEQAYLTYVQRREESRIAQEFDANRISNISLLSAPTKPITPVSPRKRLVMTLSIPIGLLLGISLALLLDYMDDIVSTRRDLSSINGLPYLGTLRFEDPSPIVDLASKRLEYSG